MTFHATVPMPANVAKWVFNETITLTFNGGPLAVLNVIPNLKVLLFHYGPTVPKAYFSSVLSVITVDITTGWYTTFNENTECDRTIQIVEQRGPFLIWHPKQWHSGDSTYFLQGSQKRQYSSESSRKIFRPKNPCLLTRPKTFSHPSWNDVYNVSYTDILRS